MQIGPEILASMGGESATQPSMRRKKQIEPPKRGLCVLGEGGYVVHMRGRSRDMEYSIHLLCVLGIRCGLVLGNGTLDIQADNLVANSHASASASDY